ncbi:MAG: S24 family peptidase, partial [Methylocystis sp.]
DIARDQILARLAERLAQLKITENEASTRAGLERTFLSQLRRNPSRWPRVDNLQRICDALGLRMYWVTTGLGPRLIAERDFGADIVEAPLVSWVAATGFSETEAVRPGDEIAYLPVPGLPRGDFIALRVVGDSMNLIAPENAIIVVDRSDTRPQPRGFYVFATHDGGEATFKRWMSRPDRLEPYSTNPAHETIYLDKPPTVIGRVRKVMLDL